MVQTPGELHECVRATAEIVKTVSWGGCRIVPEHSERSGETEAGTTQGEKK